LMRACVRVVLVLLAITAGASLAGCDSVDGLGDVTNAFVGGKLPVGPVNVNIASRTTEPVPVEIETTEPKQKPQIATRRAKSPRKSLRRKPRRALQTQAPARAVPWPQARPPNLSAQPPLARPSPVAAPQSVRSQLLRPQYRLRTLWPEPPAPGTFSR
jgi:hypothetical protein